MVIGNSSLAAAGGPVDFNRHIRPILADNCFECHGPDAEAREGELRFDLADDAMAVIDPGNAKGSELYRRLVHQDPDERMPPAKAHRRPSAQQIESIRQWIDEGAIWSKHWSFVSPVGPEFPKNLSQPDWPRNGLDALVLAHLDAEGLAPQPQAKPETLIRRVTLDLTGLPPELDRIDRFLAEWNKDPEAAYESLVDDLLASPRYGEHMAVSWLDAARYADTNGYQSDGKREMWRWRDWVVEAWNRNLPYDEFSIRQLAGDHLLPDRARSIQTGDLIRDPEILDLLLATGFNRNHRQDTGSGTIQEEALFEIAADRAETTAMVWMGLTLGCARCHDHKFDPLTMTDYYGMVAFFDQVDENGFAGVRNSHPWLVVPTAAQQPALAKLDKRVADAEKVLAAVDHSSAQAEWEKTVIASGEPIEPFKDGLAHHLLSGGASARFNGRNFKKAHDAFPKVLSTFKPFTFSARFKVADPARDQAIMSAVEKPDRNRKGFQLDVVEGGRVRIRLVSSWIYSFVDLISNLKIKPGREYHVALTCDSRGQGLALKAYLDGKPGLFTQDSEINGGGTTAAPEPLYFGKSPFNENLRGVIRDVRAYTREFSPDEISLLAERRPLHAILSIPAAERSTREAALVRHAFLENAEPREYVALRNGLAARQKFIEEELPISMVMIDRAQTKPSYARLRGQYDKLGPEIMPGTPQILPPLLGSGTGISRPSRLNLARWLFAPGHPLTARVAANRLWQQTWGQGFVNTPENFGTQAPEPAYRDVLDWLATEYVRLGWNTKAMLKTIVTSATYRQDSNAPGSLWERDPQNRLLARGPRHRLHGPAVRDQALAIGGLLGSDIGGESTVIEKMTDPGAGDRKSKMPPVDADAHHRRTLYAWWSRNAPPPSLAVFDGNDRSGCTVEIKRTNTPIQALATLNHETYLAAARGFAEQILAQSESDRFEYAWRKVTAAKPTASERELMTRSLAAHCDDFMNDEEATMALVETRNPELAAWTALANVLLNLDRTLTKE